MNGCVATFGLDRHFTFHQQIGLLQIFHESRSALAGGLELLTEIQDRLGRLARLIAIE